MEQLLEAIQRAEQNVQVFGERNVVDVAESNRNAFDVNPSIVVAGAELLCFLCIDELSVNHSILPLSPLEELEVFLVLGLVVEEDLVLFHFFAGEVVSIDIIETVLDMETAFRILDDVPTLAFEGRGLIGFRLFITHLIIKFYNKASHQTIK